MRYLILVVISILCIGCDSRTVYRCSCVPNVQSPGYSYKVEWNYSPKFMKKEIIESARISCAFTCREIN